MLFRSGWRKHYQAIAARDNNIYHEDTKNPNFVADITRADGSKLNLEANNEYNLSMSAVKSDGTDDIPSVKDFADVVARAAKENCQIEFASIEDDEFRARLLIACLEAQPRMKTKGAPSITPTFLRNIDSRTKQRLEKAMRANQQNKPRPNKPRPNKPRPRRSGGRS